MNEIERAALADELAEAIDDELQEILVTLLRTGPEFIDDAAANIRSVVSHAAIAAVPTVQADAGDDLDAMLDSVHPEATIGLGITLPGYQDKGRWVVSVFVPSGTTWKSTREVNGLVRHIEATGATRTEALRNAVAQATTTQEGTEHEQDV